MFSLGSLPAFDPSKIPCSRNFICQLLSGYITKKTFSHCQQYIWMSSTWLNCCPLKAFIFKMFQSSLKFSSVFTLNEWCLERCIYKISAFSCAKVLWENLNPATHIRRNKLLNRCTSACMHYQNHTRTHTRIYTSKPAGSKKAPCFGSDTAVIHQC